jgi:hypothetical protein
MIRAYSVVWEPVSAPNGHDEAGRVDNDMFLTGMATPSKKAGMKDDSMRSAGAGVRFSEPGPVRQLEAGSG